MEIRVRDVHEALPAGIRYLLLEGVFRDTRNGRVLVSREPVTTIYALPEERVLTWPARDANPFFHFFESLWMLAGRRDVAFLSQFAKQMASYSDDGKTFHGAYGWRWREHFAHDQLLEVIGILRKNPDDRRCVIGMWDPNQDLGRQGKDFPCNTHLYVWVNTAGRLDLQICCRSNDVIWGAYGANAVHFSVLQEFIARALGRDIGTMYQLSKDYHIYETMLDKVRELGGESRHTSNPYARAEVKPYPLMEEGTSHTTWLEDLSIFMDQGPITGFRDPFFRRVVTPLWYAHKAYKNTGNRERHQVALEILQQCQATDWRRACVEWIERRREKSGA